MTFGATAGEQLPVVTVRVPATSANLGPGFDAVGLALARHDEVTVRARDTSGLNVEVVGEGAGDVPRNESHLIVRAMYTAFERLGVRPPGLSLQCRNAIPHGRGLGSSAAAIVAGVVAARALAEGSSTAPTEWALHVATDIEGHPDNVAACLLGGLTIAWSDEDGVHAARVAASPEIAAVAFIPPTSLSTAAARTMLPQSVPHRDAAHSAGRAALLAEAVSRRPDLLFAATEDRLHQQYRAGAMPGTAELINRLRARHIAAVVSGAGPTVLALMLADKAFDPASLRELEDLAGPDWDVTPLALDFAGAELVSTSSG